jgi:hypothetical protein
MPARWPVTATLSATPFLIGLTALAIHPYRGIVATGELGMSNSAYALVTSIGSPGTALVSLLPGNLAAQADKKTPT